MNNNNRIVCNFSCGAASAVATKLAIEKYSASNKILIINAFLKQEHPDNRRFLKDCESWFGQEIKIVKSEKYDASIYNVFRKKRFIKSRNGAPCRRELKGGPLDSLSQPGDIIVLGYTVEEQKRFDNILDHNQSEEFIAPLIERGLTKADCLAIIERAGIALPAMYLKGYNNANCIGCVKGGQGYWNKIRKDFPDYFKEMAMIEQELGEGSYLFYDRKTGRRYSLLDLDPNSGRHDEVLPNCSFFCELVDQEF